MKHFFSICFLLIAFVFMLPHGLVADEQNIVIFQTTDLHGHIGDNKEPGILQIAEEIRKERAEVPGQSLWIDCGDLTQGSLSTTFDQGASMISALNAAGCDIFVPGNHDFEYGREILIKNLNAFQGTVLAANLKVQGFDNIKPWILLNCGQVRIAVIGIVPPYLNLWMEESLLQGIQVEAAEKAIDQYMPSIMAAKPHVIVLAIHLGEYTSKRLTGTDKVFNLASLATKYPQIDLILCGHSHQTEPGKRLYAGTWLVQAPAVGKDAARIDVQLKTDESVMKVDSISSKFLGITGSSPREKKLLEIFNPILNREKKFASTKIAKTDFDMKPMISSQTECRLAKEICDAMREATGADAAFSSSITNYNKSAGDVTERDLFYLISYNNRVVSCKMTPAQIRTVVKELKAKHAKLNTWMTWTGFSISSGAGEQIVSDKTGKAIPEDTLISVALNSYAASGAGGRYPELAKIVKEAPVFQKSLPDLRDVFRTYMKKHYPYIY